MIIWGRRMRGAPLEHGHPVRNERFSAKRKAARAFNVTQSIQRSLTGKALSRPSALIAGRDACGPGEEAARFVDGNRYGMPYQIANALCTD
jgi:hypothetical protein